MKMSEHIDWMYVAVVAKISTKFDKYMYVCVRCLCVGVQFTISELIFQAQFIFSTYT